MKKLALFFIIFWSPLNAESINLANLSPYEQSIHRVAWCHEAWSSVGSNGQPQLKTYQIYDIIQLLDSKDFERNDNKRVYRKTRQDLRAALILGTKILEQNDLDLCFKDLREVLAENYIPNFEYIDN